jgi:hypothetical protein
VAEGGQISVELCGEREPVKGFALADSVAVQGDNVWTPLRWRGQIDCSALNGQRLQLHIYLNRAKLFGYRVVTLAKPTRSSTPMNRAPHGTPRG